MFSKQILCTLLAIGSATAAVVPRQASAGTFYIIALDIEAQSGPDAIYSFSVADTSATPSNFSTSCFATTATSPGLGNVPSTVCADPTVSFDFSNNGTGYVLDIVHAWGEDVQHAIVLAHDDITDSAGVFFPNDRLINGASSGPFLAKINSELSFSAPFGRYVG
jgi:hypothetical protein